MVIRSKLFKMSSLCMVGAIAIVANRYKLFSDSLSPTSGIISESGDGESNSVISSQTCLVSLSIDDTDPNIIKALTTSPEENVENQEQEEANNEQPETQVAKVEVDNPIEGIDYASLLEETYKKYNNVAIANVDTGSILNIRKEAGTKSKIVGQLPKNGGCNILDTVKAKDGSTWYKITSGEITGYVSAELVITGDEAVKLITKYGRAIVTANVAGNDALNVRVKPSTDSKILYKIRKGEELDIVSVKDGWYEVNVGMGDGETGFVSAEYVDVSYDLVKAYEDNDTVAVGVSNKRTALVQEARSHLGGKYKSGGNTSYAQGVDCSGFMQLMFKQIAGVSLQRTAAQQSTQGKSISASALRPGDLVFYHNGKKVSHVGMYVGDGYIIHASTPKGGIKRTRMNYTTPYKYVNVLGD